MSKELSNIQDLKSAFISHCKELGCDENYIKVCKKKFVDIEKTLKGYEKYKTQYNIVNCYPKSLLSIDDLNKLKALEIIKEIIFIEEEDFFYDKETDTYFFIGYKVPKDKYDLLKEVLL